MRALLITSMLVAATPALADDTFEAKAQGAQRINRIENVVWALTAPCDAGDDTQNRQCRKVRDTRAAELAGATLLVDADREAFDIGAWSAQKKSMPLALAACVRCSGVELDGKTYYVVANKDGNPAPRLKAGKVEAGQLTDIAKQFPDENSAKAFAKANANARVQLVAKLAAKSKSVVDGKPVIHLDVLAYRVFSPCDGSVVLASPKSGPGDADKKQCGPIAGGKDGAEVDALTPAMINDAMKPVVEQANLCYVKHGVAGQAKLKITIAADGSVSKYEQQGDFVYTPTGNCIDAAMTKASFPRSKKTKTSLSYPLKLK